MKLPESVGEDVVPVPRPLKETPPADRFCDLVLTGGVASGVVYPWAIVELARHFNFKNIGGTSVGAMAAVLAAAAEYGRRTGHTHSFEVLRRLPAALGEGVGDGRTRMLSLFQPTARGKRLFDLFVRMVGLAAEPTIDWNGQPSKRSGRSPGKVLSAVFTAYKREITDGAVTGLLFMLACLILSFIFAGPAWGWVGGVGGLLWTAGGAIFGFVRAVYQDIARGLVRNGLGLCRGGPSGNADADRETPALVQWLHEGIQRSAGLRKEDRPLTFRDLWQAPAHAGAPMNELSNERSPRVRSINLEMVTTNVTHGRPYRLPLQNEASRLFFRPERLAPYFPPSVMRALVEASVPYEPRQPADPSQSERTRGFYELPGADLPIVVAARLSLSFPLLFSAVPLYAIDYEPTRASNLRDLKRCWFSDGGLCSNFPIHLFDCAIPRWPTFGMWLGKRSPYRPDSAVWLPRDHLSGRGDIRQRFDPSDPMTPKYRGGPRPGLLGFLLGFLLAGGVSAKDWTDRTGMRMPHVRNRVAYLGLLPGEGELNIAMPRAQILEMAHTYGTQAGKKFVKEFVAEPGTGPAARAWREQRWVRFQVLIGGLRNLLSGFSRAAEVTAHTVPLSAAIDQAEQEPALEGTAPLSPAQADALRAIVASLGQLEDSLQANHIEQPYKPQPMPDLRLRPPL